MTTPARWQHVITDAGHHLRLTGANGETVMTSEVYTDPRSAVDALRIARAAFLSGRSHRHPEVLDERFTGGPISTRATLLDEPDAVTRVWEQELYGAALADGHYPDEEPTEDLTRLLLTPTEAGLDPLPHVDPAGYVVTEADLDPSLYGVTKADLTDGILMCPECATGKHPNCTGQALHPVTDDLRPCGCDHSAAAAHFGMHPVPPVDDTPTPWTRGPRVDRGPGHEAE